MPLKIRCPHCRRILVAEDATAGQDKLCPSCGKVFNVPIPVQEESRHVEVAAKCSKCGAEIAPGTEYCPHCFFDPSAGSRLPLRRRLQYISIRAWMLTGLCAVAAIALILVGTHLLRNRLKRGEQATSAPIVMHDADRLATEWASRLIEADSATARAEALEKLVRLGSSALPAVARKLQDATGTGGQEAIHNRAAAVHLLARSADARWLPLLRKLRVEEGLSEHILHARAQLNDADVAGELATLWLERLRRQMLLERVAALTTGTGPVIGEAVRRAQSEAERCAESLRGLAQLPETTVIDDVVARYWDGWSWLGQQRGEVLAVEMFDLAKPPKRKNLEFKYRVRAAREALDRVAQRATPEARAATGVILTQCAPQYKSLRQRVIATLASILPESEPVAQQRISWALARLTSHSFGGLSEKDSPADFSLPAVLDVLKWVRSSGVAEVKPLRTASAAYPTPPLLTRRVVTPQRQQEQDLLRELGSGWDAIGPVLDHWLEAELGFTPRIAQLLDPTQRAPDYPVLAGAIILAAESEARDAQPQLELWRQATDQPAWVRSFACTALAALDAKQGTPRDGWPAELDGGTFDRVGKDRPDWDLWGRLLASGGPRLRVQLESAPRGSLPATVRAKLLAGLEEAARRQSQRP